MEKYFTVIAVLCLAVSVASYDDDDEYAPDLNKCKKVTEAPNFDFYKYIDHNYRVAMLPDITDLQDWKSAYYSTIQVNGSWFFTISINKYSGIQWNTPYKVNDVEGAKINATRLIQGYNIGHDYILRVYAFKENSYVQYHVCGGKGTDPELRFAILFGDTKLTVGLAKELVANDAKLGFTSKLVTIGQRKDVAIIVGGDDALAEDNKIDDVTI